MRNYVLDLAFDADETREHQGLFHPLQAGLVEVDKVDTGQGIPRWFTQFDSEDRLHFRVWDISQGTSGSVLLNFWAGFFEINSTSQLACVTDQLNPLVFAGCADLPTVNTAEVKSSVYTSPRAAPRRGWLVGENAQPPLGQALTLNTVSENTRYVLQVRVELNILGVLRSYVFDPEIIIGPNG